MARPGSRVAVTERILDWIFPPECAICTQQGAWICGQCHDTFIRVPQNKCPWCERASLEGERQGTTCNSCREKTHIAGFIFAWSYHHEGIKRIVHRCKFEGMSVVCAPMGGDIVAAIRSLWEGRDFDAIVPAPLHKKRLRERGFNQAYEITRSIGTELHIPIIDGMTRTRATRAQATMDHAERESNVRDAFTMKDKSASLAGKTILLIDDVCTTGATIQQAAKVLKEAGAKRIYAAAFARGWDADIPISEGQLTAMP